MRKFERVREAELLEKNILKEDVILPKRATKSSVAYDIYAPYDFIIKGGESLMVWTGVKAKFNEDEALLINVRSSMGKKNIMLKNIQGWIESDYYGNPDNDGDLGLMFYNYGETDWVVTKGERISQCMFIKYLVTENDTAEGSRTGGFGSTGK